MRPWRDVQAGRSPAVEAGARHLEERRRARPRPAPPGRYFRVDWKIVLPGIYLGTLWTGRPARAADVYGAALLILLACEPVFISGWLRPSIWWRRAADLLGGLSAGTAGSRWKHLRCRLHGHEEGEEYFTCPRHGQLDAGDVMEDVPALVGARCTRCWKPVIHTPAPSCCTVCGDPLLPGPGSE